MKTPLIISILILAFGLTGCDQLARLGGLKKTKGAEQEPVAVIPMVENSQLAEMILRPKHEKIVLERDPFRPVGARAAAKTEVADQGIDELINDMQYLGVVRVDERYSALIKTSKIKGVFGIQDRIGHLTVTDIQEDFVLLNNGIKSYKIKRGAK